MDFSNLNHLQLDALKEAGSIGAGNAATALSTLLRQRIKMNVPRASVLSLATVGELLGGPETSVWAIYLKMAGELEGHVIFILPNAIGTVLVDLLMRRPTGSTKIIDEVGESALAEMGNILTSNYLTALGTLTKLDLRPSPPLTANDMVAAVLDGVIADISVNTDAVLTLETELIIGDTEGLIGYLFLFLEPASAPNLLGALGLAG
ncbi:MAG: chemotaxis protein CheC [Cyanobacteria bacterium NC_groundwater_1444_Ag_S-0.65um_54_12]|nr:chemotaxis protein CheC [Cyanobacteria bacterium NC_groundwater_1444_Ag_S-0.65um_54_12]